MTSGMKNSVRTLGQTLLKMKQISFPMLFHDYQQFYHASGLLRPYHAYWHHYGTFTCSIFYWISSVLSYLEDKARCLSLIVLALSSLTTIDSIVSYLLEDVLMLIRSDHLQFFLQLLDSQWLSCFTALFSLSFSLLPHYCFTPLLIILFPSSVAFSFHWHFFSWSQYAFIVYFWLVLIYPGIFWYKGEVLRFLGLL